ncbi:SRPBCC family protein [Subtercola sp. YIM 133946]|uniref:SRPBCC family protein n=1 Tax=Subtercola sp. YIM 133946 TaxID=3118909 RepID=UPI002F95CC97
MNPPETSRHISVVIARPVGDVYDFVVDPANLARWASGLSSSTELIDGRWYADSPMGRIEVSFAPRNEFGVLDHDVTAPSGQVFVNPMRVIAHPSGSEVVFTIQPQPGVAPETVDADAATVAADLITLRTLLEA